MSNPLPNANVPQIPQPIADIGALVYVCQALKQGMDSLGGNRGSTLDRAVTYRDLVTLGLVASTSINTSSNTITVVPAPPVSVVTPYVISGFMPSLMTPKQIIFGHQFPIAVTFPGNFGPLTIGLFSEFGSFVAATGTPVFDIQKCASASDPTNNSNWSTIGTATFSGHTTTLSTSGDVVFANSDFMRVLAPTTPDPTLTQLYMCLVGKR